MGDTTQLKYPGRFTEPAFTPGSPPFLAGNRMRSVSCTDVHEMFVTRPPFVDRPHYSRIERGKTSRQTSHISITAKIGSSLPLGDMFPCIRIRSRAARMWDPSPGWNPGDS